MAELKRSLSLFMLVLYGLGVTVGAGIYVLIGEVAGRAGMAAPFSFVLASVAAGFSALSFGEMVARFPESAGEAVYVEAGFRKSWVAQSVGFAVVCAGTVSSAAVALGASAYFITMVPVPKIVVVVVLIGGLGLLAARGIVESVVFAGLMTLIEVGGLVAIAGGAVVADPEIVARLPEIGAALDVRIVGGLLSGAVLAFFAFIGFEDMVNIAEEVRDPTRTLPRAILITLVLAALIYFSVAAVAVLVVAPDVLQASPAPLATVAAEGGIVPPHAISAIAVAAGLNGILVQIVMASRVLYGLGKRGWAPAIFARVNAKTRTPILATFSVVAVSICLALTLPIARLAEGTSVLTLTIFLAVNVSLVLLKLRNQAAAPAFAVPIWVPAAGSLICAAFILAAFL